MSLSAIRYSTAKTSNIRREQAASKTRTAPTSIYAGLRDSRGPVSRYEKAGHAMPTRAFMKAYLLSGGRLDSMGVWGFTPEMLAHLEGRFTAQECAAALAIFGRADFLNMDAVAEIVADGQTLNSPNYHAAVRGLERVKIIDAADCPTTKSLMGLGWMKQVKFDRMVADNMRAGDAVKFQAFRGWIAKNFNMRGNRVFMKARRDQFKGAGSFWIDSDTHVTVDRKLNILDVSERDHVKKGTQFVGCSLKYENFCWKTGRLNGRINKRDSQQTSAGRCYFKTNSIDHSMVGQVRIGEGWYNPGILHQARRVGQNWVLKIGATTFVWADSFDNHVEAPTLKQALEILAKRQKKAGYILSLNDVRNDRTGTAGYCLAGVKNFLSARMKWVYFLVKDFNSWAEIPAEIMAIEWHLTGPQVFSGYSNPVVS